MILAVYITACLGFCAAFLLLRILPHARLEMGTLWSDIAILRSPELSETEKELHARRAAVRAVGGTARLVLRLCAVAAGAVAPIWLADAAGIASAGAVTAFAVRADVLVVTTVLVIGVAVLIRRRGAGRA